MAAVPEEAELEAAKAALAPGAPRPPAPKVDPQVLAIYQATFDRDFPVGGMELVCQTLGLDIAKYPGKDVRHHIVIEYIYIYDMYICYINDIHLR